MYTQIHNHNSLKNLFRIPIGFSLSFVRLFGIDWLITITNNGIYCRAACINWIFHISRNWYTFLLLLAVGWALSMIIFRFFFLYFQRVILGKQAVSVFSVNRLVFVFHWNSKWNSGGIWQSMRLSGWAKNCDGNILMVICSCFSCVFGMCWMCEQCVKMASVRDSIVSIMCALNTSPMLRYDQRNELMTTKSITERWDETNRPLKLSQSSGRLCSKENSGSNIYNSQMRPA